MNEDMLRIVLSDVLNAIHEKLGNIERGQQEFQAQLESMQRDQQGFQAQLESMQREQKVFRDDTTSRLGHIQSQLNVVENRVQELTESIRLTVRQNAAEMGEMRHEMNRVKAKVGLQ